MVGGGMETYRDQFHSVSFIASLAPAIEVTTVAVCDRAHDEVVAEGVRSIGISSAFSWSRGRLWDLLDGVGTDVFLCRSPNRHALRWGARSGVAMLPTFADIMRPEGLRGRWHGYLTGSSLKSARCPCVGNHSLTATRSLSRIGVSAAQSVPWEFRAVEASEVIKRFRGEGAFELFFAGAVIEAKGVGDCIEAVGVLAGRGLDVVLTVAGPCDVSKWQGAAAACGAEGRVSFLGQVSSSEMLERMRGCDAVVVPSRHAYPEGIPNTIFEALASRTPLVCSDHPAFASRLEPGRQVAQFPAMDVGELASTIERLMTDGDWYVSLSEQSAEALAGLYIGTEWTELVGLFLDDPENRRGWVRAISLAGLGLA